MLLSSFVFSFSTISFFLLLVSNGGDFCRFCLCAHVNQSIEITDEGNRRLGLQLTPSLEIISIDSDSLVAKQAPLDSAGGGIRIGDRISGINGLLFEDEVERTIDYFISTVSKLKVPYTIEFEFAPRKVQSQISSVSSPSPLYRTELHVRLVDNIHSVMSAENDLQLTAYMSEDSYDLKHDVFNCEYTPIVVADPMNACTSIARMAGSNGQLKGAFVVVSRGVCAFEAKVEHLKFAGAAGAIVINTDDNVFSIPRPPDRGQQRSHDNINVPIIMITKSDGEQMLKKIIGDVHNTLSATSLGFEFRGHENGIAAVGKMLVSSVCNTIEEDKKSEEREEERRHLDQIRHRMQFARERRFQQQQNKGKKNEVLDSSNKNTLLTGTNEDLAKSIKPAEREVLETTVDSETQFEVEYNKLKSLPPSVFKDSRRRNLLFSQIQATFSFSVEQIQSIRTLMFGDDGAGKDEL